MNSSVYEVKGCAGSRIQAEVETGLDSATARRKAAEHNRRVADGRGISYRTHAQESGGGEGWRFGQRSGRDGYRIALQYI